MKDEDIKNYLRINSEVVVNQDGSMLAEGIIERQFSCEIFAKHMFEYILSRKLKPVGEVSVCSKNKDLFKWSCKVEAI